MEGPGIPLVKSDGYYARYVSTDQLIEEDKITMSSGIKSPEIKQHLGHRLRRRKELIGRRSMVVDLSFLLSITGVVIIVIDTELQFAGVVSPLDVISIAMRAVTTVTSVLLVMSVVAYNLIGVQLKIVSAGLDNWQLVITYSTMFKMIAEAIVCFFHPFPFGDIRIPMTVVEIESDRAEFTTRYVPLNSILAILMFLRLYILGRFLVVHSDLFKDTTVQSLGTLSKVNINAQFVFKALMTTRPGTCLSAILVTTLLINSWSLRVCEYHTNPADGKDHYAQALWLTAVTFLTLGYGDVTPQSICGRVIAIQTGLMGVGIMALCVAVLARKLEQTRPERYVHTFVQQIHMDKIRRNAAADVVKQSFIVWRLRKRGYSMNHTYVLRHRRKLLDAIRKMNQSHLTKSHLRECAIGTVEVSKGVHQVNDLVSSLKEENVHVNQRLENLEKLVTNIHFQLYEMKEILRDKETSKKH
ncbi:small conductance calcium-activated potassium channel protein 2-like [Argopecten irradians]|uniref:small conductance calcium-activated potassium channel protein 2-like n=1 Tax=Argopecten irradians TaxID=31199 RepID=UPI003720F60A